MESRGFLLIATTHPYFGRMAANLANSIKATSKDVKIAILTDGAALSHLNDAERRLFDHVIDTRDLPKGVGGAMRTRLSFPEISPFDVTASMDVDTIWLPHGNVDRMFALLDNHDFTIVNEGYVDLDNGEDHSNKSYYHWGSADEIAEAFDLTGKLYKTRGEFFVFRKSEKTGRLFERARWILDNPMIDVSKLAGAVTDEFAFNIALNQEGIEPHQSKWQPAFWPLVNGGVIPPIYKLKEYYAISFGGNALTRTGAKVYESVGRAAAYKTGVPFRFPLYAKRSFSPERRKI